MHDQMNGQHISVACYIGCHFYNIAQLLMGNLNRCKVDIVANVPEEVAFLILRLVEPQDIVQCVLVCRRWKAVISGQGLLWHNVAKKWGFPLEATRYSRPACESYRDAFIALQKRQSQITSAAFSSHRFMTLQGRSSHCAIEWSDGSLVRTKLLGEGGTRVVVESLGLNGLYSQSSFVVHSRAAVVWIYASPDAVYVATKDGVWRGYDRLEGRLHFQRQGCLMNEEQGLTFGCCHRCTLVVSAHWATNPGALTCNLQAVQLHSDGTAPDDVISWTVFWRHHRTSHVEHDSRFTARKVMIVPANEGDDQCSVHRVILQCDCCTVAYSLEMSPKKRVDKGLCLNCDCSTANGFLGDEGTRSQTHPSLACTSHDGSFLGTVSDNRLRVWELSRRPCLISCATLTPPADARSVHLVGVGSTLALVVYVTPCSTVTAYILQVVNVCTGQVLRHFERVKEKYTWNHDACVLSNPLRNMRFEHRADDDWLSDITCDIPSPLLWALHSCRSHTHVEAVFLNITAVP